MRKLLFGIIIIIFIFCLLNNSEEDKEIRVRIIPNSDSRNDLLAKEDIKNAVICYLEMIYDKSYDKYLENINDTYNDLEKKLDSLFGEVSVSFSKHTLYNKTYNNNAIKNEEAYTLYIVIGNGNGSNWWGSVYPRFLSVNSSEVLEYKSLFYDLISKLKEN